MTAPKQYRKKPVVIEAMQMPRADSAVDQSRHAHAVYSWVETNTRGSFEPMDVIKGRKPYPASGVSIDPRDGRFIISTLEGLHGVDLGDWIIRGVQGEFYPCKPDIFAQTYELVDGQAHVDGEPTKRGWYAQPSLMNGHMIYSAVRTYLVSDGSPAEMQWYAHSVDGEVIARDWSDIEQAGAVVKIELPSGPVEVTKLDALRQNVIDAAVRYHWSEVAGNVTSTPSGQLRGAFNGAIDAYRWAVGLDGVSAQEPDHG